MNEESKDLGFASGESFDLAQQGRPLSDAEADSSAVQTFLQTTEEVQAVNMHEAGEELLEDGTQYSTQQLSPTSSEVATDGLLEREQGDESIQANGASGVDFEEQVTYTCA